ncbi:MAG: zinc ABC transporter substrate-binding protein [Saprospiraceae bacterium]|nr:zinc ABC transporter substrate-binding protein [Candidatus Vicinibacter affinis]
MISTCVFGKPKVIATASMWADMCAVIGSERIDLDLIVPIGSDPHLYEPTPADLVKVGNADLILINGLTFEGWLGKLIQNSGTKAKVVLITEGIQAIESKDFHNATDPHAWMDVENGIIYASNIAKALSELVPLYADEFAYNFGVYKKELEELHRFVQEKINAIPKERRVLITSHDAFHYFGKKYGIQLEPLQGTSTEADVQSATLVHIHKIIKDQGVSAIFVESTINPKMMQQLRAENKIEIGGKLYADSLGDPSSPASTYIKMLKHNATVISEALSKSVEDSQTKKKSTGSLIFLWITLFYVFAFGLIYFINKN